jgi:hypothetical protein
MGMPKMGDPPGCCEQAAVERLVRWDGPREPPCGPWEEDPRNQPTWCIAKGEVEADTYEVIAVSFCPYCGAALHGDGTFTPRRTPKAGTVTFDAKSMVWVADALVLARLVMAETPCPMPPKQAEVVEALYAVYGPESGLDAPEQEPGGGGEQGPSPVTTAPAMTRWERLLWEDRLSLLDALAEEAAERRRLIAEPDTDAPTRAACGRVAHTWETARAALMRPDTVTSKGKSTAEYQAEVAACDRRSGTVHYVLVCRECGATVQPGNDHVCPEEVERLRAEWWAKVRAPGGLPKALARCSGAFADEAARIAAFEDLAEAVAVVVQASVPRRPTGIYVASKTKHAARWLALRAQGCPIVSTWIDEAGVGETSDWRDLWDRCLSEATGAAALVMYVEPGEAHKGSLAEVGAALYAGVPVFWVGPEVGTVRRHRGVTVCDTLEQAMEAAGKAVLRARVASS